MINEGHPHSAKFREGIDEVWASRAALKDAINARQDALKVNEEAQQYLFDASEAEAWMGEQELYLMGDEKAKVGIQSYSSIVPHARRCDK